MATQKQLEANRNNAKKAGVKSEEGKEVVRHNSFKHGLTSKELITGLSNYSETMEDFELILSGLRAAFAPRNALEESLVLLMAKAQLKMRRYETLEATMFLDYESFLDKRDMIYISNISGFELILKYKQSIESQFYRALEAINRTRQAQQLDLFLPEEK